MHIPNIIIILIITVLVHDLDCLFIESSPPYCDNDLCKKLDKYCCGYNECCFSWTFWYLWTAFGVGIIVGIVCMWQCYLKSDKSQKHFSSVKCSSSFDQQNMSRKKDALVAYLPLGNCNQKFLENKIDDKNTHVSQFFWNISFLIYFS